MAPRTSPEQLLEKAYALPDAQPTDFLGDRRPPSDIAPNLLKVINDTALRSRLIGAGFAEGLQSPKGPQKIPSIIRLYPERNAPESVKTSSGGRRPGRPGRKAAQAPTVEEMESLLTRIRAIEGHVARELSMSIDAEIDQAQKQVASAASGDVEKAFHELGHLLEKRRDGRQHVRKAAFKQIAADKEFALRGHIGLLSDEVPQE